MAIIVTRSKINGRRNSKAPVGRLEHRALNPVVADNKSREMLRSDMEFSPLRVQTRQTLSLPLRLLNCTFTKLNLKNTQTYKFLKFDSTQCKKSIITLV